MRLFAFIFLVTLVMGCQNIDDANPSTRETFIRLFEGPLSFTAAAVEKTSDGYVILGNMKVSDDSLVTLIIKTDKRGSQIEPTAYFSGGTGNAIKPFSNSAFSGYIIVGDSIKIDPNQPQGGNIEVSSLRLLFIDENLKKVRAYTISDSTASGPQQVKTDIHGSSLTITADGRVVVLGTYQPDNSPQKPFIQVLKNNLQYDWRDLYTVLDRDYINGKSVHYSNGRILWASSILRQQGNFSESYITIPYIQEPLAFSNYSILGEDESKAFFVNDIKPSSFSGYGIVGTYGETDGAKKNMFFSRVNSNGTIIKKDVLFFDAILSKISSVESQIDDTGDALTATSDGGFVLAGTIFTTPEKGNGAHDVLLVKIDAFGEIIWSRTIGGAGDETVSAVVETEDKGILICGTNTIGSYSSIFIIKTNEKGEY